jgi:hypothetical protein
MFLCVLTLHIQILNFHIYFPKCLGFFFLIWFWLFVCMCVCLLLLFDCFQDKVFLCNTPCFPGSYFIDQSDLKLTDISLVGSKW